MTPLRRRLAWIAGAAIAAGAIDVIVVLSSDRHSNRGWFAAVSLLIGWAFVGTGMFAWVKRPDSRIGALMSAVGLAWFFNPLSYADSGWLFLLGSAFGPLPLAFLAHLMLAFPDGRLHNRFERVVIGGCYAATTVLSVPVFLFFNSATDSRCENCPANPILIHESDLGVNLSVGILNTLSVVLIVTVVVLMRRRWKASTGPQRRALGPVLWASGLTFAGFAVLVASVLVPPFNDNPDARQLIFMGALLIFLTVPFAFLAGFMRMKLSRADAVGQIVDRLAQRGDKQMSLRDALAETLGDESLEIAYCLRDKPGFADSAGRPVVLPGESSGRVITPIELEGERIAVVITERPLVEEALLIRVAGGALALTMENERLTAELRARVEELRASRARIVQAGDEERRRLERDLHDGAQQRLVALSLNLKLARGSLESDPAGAHELLDDAIAELTEATAELRELARGIHPAVLTDRGLDAAVGALAARATIPVELLSIPEERMAAPVESTAYFVVAESLTNVARYSRASHAEVDIHRDNGRLVVEVRDDGVGGADPARGSGLRGLADRVGAVDGRIAVESPPGGGTTVHVEIPCGP